MGVEKRGQLGGGEGQKTTDDRRRRLRTDTQPRTTKDHALLAPSAQLHCSDDVPCSLTPTSLTNCMSSAAAGSLRSLRGRLTCPAERTPHGPSGSRPNTVARSRRTASRTAASSVDVSASACVSSGSTLARTLNWRIWCQRGTRWWLRGERSERAGAAKRRRGRRHSTRTATSTSLAKDGGARTRAPRTCPKTRTKDERSRTKDERTKDGRTKDTRTKTRAQGHAH